MFQPEAGQGEPVISCLSVETVPFLMVLCICTAIHVTYVSVGRRVVLAKNGGSAVDA